MSWRDGVQRFRGHWSFDDDLYDARLTNNVSFNLSPDEVIFEISGPLMGDETVRLGSRERKVIRLFYALVKVARVTAYKYRKIVPVPKPVSGSRKAPQRDHRQAAGVCAWCGGTGEYEGKDGCWVECQHCRKPEPGDEDIDGQP